MISGAYSRIKYCMRCWEPDNIEEYLSSHPVTVQGGSDEWLEGDQFTTPETGDKIFTVNKVLKYDVEASDQRSRAGITSFSKSYITKVKPTPANTNNEQ